MDSLSDLFTPRPQYGAYPSGGYGGYGYGQPMPWQIPQESPLTGMLKSFAGARYNLTPTDTSGMSDIASRMGNLSDAMVNPNNATYQQIYGAENGAAQQDLAGAIAEASRQNRKLSLMGRTPLFDNERGGEQAFRQLIGGYTTAQDTARQRARQIIGAGQQGLAGSLSAQSALTQARDSNRQKQAFGIGNVADFLGKLF